MNDLDTILREASAETRSAFSPVSEPEVRPARARSPRGLTAALAGAAVVLGLGLPALLLQPGGQSPPPLGSEVTTTSLASSSTVALDPSWLVPTVADVEAIIADAEAAGAPDVLSPGWRPPLVSEGLWCLYRDSPGAATVASNGPLDLDHPLTVDDLLAECAPGNNDGLSDTTPIPTEFTVCRGTFEESVYKTMWTSDGSEIVERATAPVAGFPVVLGWASDCTSEDLATNPVVRLSADLELGAVNKIRSIEIALRGHELHGTCPAQDAETLARSVHQEFGTSWTLLQRPGTAWCGLWIDPEWAVISFGGETAAAEERLGSEDGSSTSPQTSPPTAPTG
ncbi:MAG TPA: hypothetical protein VJA46_02120 [Acidimicrobiia bacterium]|nr:hypothetical protein [Acidimicrobiia bacterium]